MLPLLLQALLRQALLPPLRLQLLLGLRLWLRVLLPLLVAQPLLAVELLLLDLLGSLML